MMLWTVNNYNTINFSNIHFIIFFISLMMKWSDLLFILSWISIQKFSKYFTNQCLYFKLLRRNISNWAKLRYWIWIRITFITEIILSLNLSHSPNFTFLNPNSYIFCLFDWSSFSTSVGVWIFRVAREFLLWVWFFV